MKRFSLGVIGLSLFLGTALTSLTPAFAQEPTATDAPVVTSSESAMNAYGENVLKGIEVLNFVLIIAATILMFSVIKRYGSQAQMSGVFGYFLAGFIALGFSRFFILIAELGIIHISDETLNVGWHLIFYISMITFFLGGKSLASISRDDGKAASLKKTLSWDSFMAVYIIAVFAAAEVLDKPILASFGGSALDRLGVIHFIAFIAAGLAAYYLFQRARVGRITTVIATPFLIAFLLLSLEHFYELLVESWGVIHFSVDIFGELFEEIFVVPALVLIVVAFARLRKLVSTPL